MRRGAGDAELVASVMIVDIAAGGYEGRARSYSPEPPDESNPLRAILCMADPPLAAEACATLDMMRRVLGKAADVLAALGV